MEILGHINKLFDIKTFKKGFRKRELVIITDEKYPQSLLVEFIQDKINLLNDIKQDDYVKISVYLRGREWRNQNGIIKYINSIQGWKIELINTERPLKYNNSRSYKRAEEDLKNLIF